MLPSVYLSVAHFSSHNGIYCRLNESEAYYYVRWRRISLSLSTDRFRAFFFSSSSAYRVLWLIHVHCYTVCIEYSFATSIHLFWLVVDFISVGEGCFIIMMFFEGRGYVVYSISFEETFLVTQESWCLHAEEDRSRVGIPRRSRTEKMSI